MISRFQDLEFEDFNKVQSTFPDLITFMESTSDNQHRSDHKGQQARDDLELKPEVRK